MVTAPAPTPLTLMLERIGAVLFGFVALAALSHAIGWDRLFDTGFLLAAIGRVVWPGPPRGAVPWLSVYLWLDAVIQLGVSLCFPSVMLIAVAVLVGVYGVALAGRLRASGIAIGALPWRGGLALMLGALGPLVLLYLPMAAYHRADPMWTGPLVVTVGQATTMSAGRTVDFGTDVVLRGVQLFLGRGVALLLAGTASLAVARTAGLVAPARALPIARGAAVAVALWWLLIARGWDAPAGLLFAAGLGWLLYVLFARPGQPGTGKTA